MKKWRQILAVTTAASLAVSPGVMAAENADAKVLVGEAFQKLLTDAGNSEFETLLGLNTLEKAMAESASSMTMGAAITVPESGDTMEFDLTTAVDPVSKSMKLSAELAAQDVEIGAAIYADGEKIQAQVPTVAEDVLVIPYREGVTGEFPEGSIFTGMEEEVDLICDVIGKVWDTISFDVEGALTRFQEQSVSYQTMVDGIQVNAQETTTLVINGEEQECDVYEVLINGQLINDYVTEFITFVKEDEEVWTAVQPWLDLLITMESSEYYDEEDEVPTSEEIWAETIDDYLEEWVEIRTDIPTEIPVNVAVYDGRVAEIFGTWGESGDSLYVDIAFKSGDYPDQNYTMYLEVQDGEDISSVYMERAAEVSEEGADIFYTHIMDEPDSSRSISMNTKYDAASGEFEICTMGEGEYAEEMNLKGAITELEKGKSIAVEIYDVPGHVNDVEGTGTIKVALNAGIGEIAALEGPELNVLTATQQDFMNYIVKFMTLAQQMENLYETETEMSVEE